MKAQEEKRKKETKKLTVIVVMKIQRKEETILVQVNIKYINCREFNGLG